MSEEIKKSEEQVKVSPEAEGSLSAEKLGEVVGGLKIARPGDPCEGGEIVSKLSLG